jgi:hypothetical protein
MDMKQTDFHGLNAKQRSALAKIPTSLPSDGLDRLSGVVGLHRHPQSWIPVDALNVATGKTESSQ